MGEEKPNDRGVLPEALRALDITSITPEALATHYKWVEDHYGKDIPPAALDALMAHQDAVNAAMGGSSTQGIEK